MDEYDVDKFSYDTVPLDPSLDSIRILSLLPAKDGGAIRCHLTTVTFAQRCKYKALSYRWGSTAQNTKRLILVNGRSLPVSKNLFQALKTLRNEKEASEDPLWVDAICINQSDIEERNSQVAMMPWIYSRAKTVLVWLGVPREKGDTGTLSWMINSEYWKRVWIIQEIGLARRILICFQVQDFRTTMRSMEWVQFIQEIKDHVPALKTCLPYKLKMQLDGKYGNEHGLQELVESHADKRCKDPRDHIYGFVGLANDCQDGFPMDYQKPLYEVWKDVMAFKNSRNGHSAHDIMHFGKLVHDLLGGKALVDFEESNEDPPLVQAQVPKEPAGLEKPPLGTPTGEDGRASTKIAVKTKVKIRCRVAGRIVHIGPPYEEAISAYKSIAKWKASINRWLPEDKRPSAREESDLFLEALESIEDNDLDVVSAVKQDVSWDAKEMAESIARFVQSSNPMGFGTVVSTATSTNSNSDKSSGMAHLFLIGGIRSLYASEGSCPGAIGLAPSEAQVDDYICQVHGLRKAVIVRMTCDTQISGPGSFEVDCSFKIIGTAGLAQNCTKARAARNDDAGPKFVEANFDYLDERDAFELLVDMPFSYSLLE